MQERAGGWFLDRFGPVRAPTTWLARESKLHCSVIRLLLLMIKRRIVVGLLLER
jgi:hypothetical protein